MENSVCVNYKENLEWLVQVADTGRCVRKLLRLHAASVQQAFIFETAVKLRELKPIRLPLLFQGYSGFSRCRSASTLTARAPEPCAPIFSFQILKLFFGFFHGPLQAGRNVGVSSKVQSHRQTRGDK